LEFQEEAAHVLVVSDAFEGMNLTSRLDNLYDRVQEHGIDAKRLILSFEPYTQAEFDEAERLSKDEKSRSLLESHHVAASS
jgi:acid stress-induced BolA-like protein IbaG/YrbA